MHEKKICPSGAFVFDLKGLTGEQLKINHYHIARLGERNGQIFRKIETDLTGCCDERIRCEKAPQLFSVFSERDKK